MNLCLALLIVELAFGLGIHRADHPRLCQVIAVTLNYFLLCTLTWLGCGGVMLVRIIKLKDRIVTEQNDTILKYYLVAWGKCDLILLNLSASVCLAHPNYNFNFHFIGICLFRSLCLCVSKKVMLVAGIVVIRCVKMIQMRRLTFWIEVFGGYLFPSVIKLHRPLAETAGPMLDSVESPEIVFLDVLRM